PLANDAAAVDLCAVLAVHVLHEPVAVFERQLAMLAGHIGEPQHHVARLAPANRQTGAQQGNVVAAPDGDQLSIHNADPCGGRGHGLLFSEMPRPSRAALPFSCSACDQSTLSRLAKTVNYLPVGRASRRPYSHNDWSQTPDH